MGDNKILDGIRTSWMEHYLDAGHWPEVRWEHGNGIVHMSLFEYGAVMNQVHQCFHLTLQAKGYKLGIYEHLRSRAWTADCQAIAGVMRPAVTADLVEGRLVVLQGLADFGCRSRWATVVEGEYSPCIFDIQVLEINGYFPDCGSAYVWELQAVQLDGVWCPFELTPEERAFEKEVEGCHVATALVANRFAAAAGV